MIFAAAFKVFSTMSSRRFMSDLRDAHAKGYICRYGSPLLRATSPDFLGKTSASGELVSASNVYKL